jgi:hypothetical protein
MSTRRFCLIIGALCLGVLLSSVALAQSTKSKCGPDHAILYKKAVKLLDSAAKKLAAKYTAEAKVQVKEANSLFTILVKECGPEQKGRALTPTETQQEAANTKKSSQALKRAELLEKSALEKIKKGQAAEAKGQVDLAKQNFRQAKSESERAHALAIEAEIYALRNQQLIFRFLANQPTP